MLPPGPLVSGGPSQARAVRLHPGGARAAPRGPVPVSCVVGGSVSSMMSGVTARLHPSALPPVRKVQDDPSLT